ncbi:MAG: hypothetical protein NTW86_15600 [Candidatus Sumerlaeota bacterium]|nr:hypothetical protein [Candidatus Sumerlaeota bacterium]
MFFIVKHTWPPASEEKVSQDMIRLFVQCFYGKVGNPWPKLFHAWQDPRSPVIYALWESSTRKMLEAVFADESRTSFTTEITHVRQLYPPHENLYSCARIATNPDLPQR